MSEPFNRPLHEAEHSLLLHLAACHVAAAAGISLDEAFDHLGSAAGEDEVRLEADSDHARILWRGTVLVECARDWLAFRSRFPGDDPFAERAQ